MTNKNANLQISQAIIRKTRFQWKQTLKILKNLLTQVVIGIFNFYYFLWEFCTMYFNRIHFFPPAPPRYSPTHLILCPVLKHIMYNLCCPYTLGCMPLYWTMVYQPGNTPFKKGNSPSLHSSSRNKTLFPPPNPWPDSVMLELAQIMHAVRTTISSYGQLQYCVHKISFPCNCLPLLVLTIFTPTLLWWSLNFGRRAYDIIVPCRAEHSVVSCLAVWISIFFMIWIKI